MIVVTLAALGIIYLVYRVLCPRPISGIPYNASTVLSFLGDVPGMIRDLTSTPDLSFNDWCAKQPKKLNSPLCQVFLKPFAKRILQLSDFDEALDIASRRTDDFDRGTFMADSFAAFGNFHTRMPTGPEFKASRRWLQDLMTPSFLNGFVAPSTYALVLRLPFSASGDLDRLNFNIMARFFFGEHFGRSSVDAQIELLSDEKAPELGSRGEAVFPEGAIDSVFYTLHDAGRTRIQATKRQLTRDQIQKSIQRIRSGEKSAGIDYMLSREQFIADQEGREPDFENDMILAEFLSIAYAGMDTTEANISWALKFIIKNPQVQENLRHALHSAYPLAVEENRLPTVAEFFRTTYIPYLDALLEETLRLHPVLSTRDAIRDTEVLGHHVPKGTTVFLLPNGPSFLNSTTRVVKPSTKWNETGMTTFNPERWLGRNSQGEVEFDPTAGPQSAFGHGPRACWGRREAYLRMKISLTLLVWSFDFLEVPGSMSSMAARPVFVHTPKEMFIRPRPRV
ncbi:cytochrome P450 [Trichoderma austrokoningii]